MRHTLLALALLACAASVQAQQTLLEPPATQRCLTPAPEQRGTPEYPAYELMREMAGRVKVDLRFDGPDVPPAVWVMESEGGDDFAKAVRAHVSGWRVPCLLEVEGPSRLIVDFRFRPEERKVSGTQPADPREKERQRMIQCITHPSGDPALPYPRWAQEQQVQGRVVVLQRFEGPDKPPVVQVYARPSMQRLAQEVEAWVAAKRMPCHEGEPVTVTTNYKYILDSDRWGFRPMTLVQFLSMVRGIRQAKVSFDFNTMSCPFQVGLRYLQPLRPNSVYFFGEPVASREPFQKWLAGVDLDVPKRALDAVYGDDVELTVPCGRLQLEPKG